MGEKLKQMAHVENSVAHLVREVVTDVFDRSQIGRDLGPVVTLQLFATNGWLWRFRRKIRLWPTWKIFRCISDV